MRYLAHMKLLHQYQWNLHQKTICHLLLFIVVMNSGMTLQVPVKVLWNVWSYITQSYPLNNSNVISQCTLIFVYNQDFNKECVMKI